MAGAPHGGEEAAGAFPPFDAALFPSQIFWFVLSFGVLFWLVATVIIPKIRHVVENRAETIRKDLEAAAAESAAAEASRSAAEKAGATARAEGRKLVDEVNARVQADIAAQTAKIDAAEAEKAMAAEARIQAMRADALASVNDLAADLATEITAKVAGVKTTAKQALGVLKAGAA
jgi:F-type H+-transporting ATPase subunit b